MRKTLCFCLMLVGAAGVAGTPDGAIDVRVRQTPGGPRIFVDGKAIRPRFFYGSPPCLCPISFEHVREFNIPFLAEEDSGNVTVAIDLVDEKEKLWLSRPRLVDETAGVTNSLSVRARGDGVQHYRQTGLKVRKGHFYRFLFDHRAARYRTFFTHRVSYVRGDGTERTLPLPYWDTLCDTVRLAAGADVNLVTFSTDTSWGCERWWSESGDPSAYARIDETCRALIAANPKVLLVPRVSANAPPWLLKRRPDMRMKFDNGQTCEMSSVSCRDYRKEAVAQIERLARHLRETFPRNFAGMHVCGQSSAEWFYNLSDTKNLSGYDVHTKEAFRSWLARRGASDAATAEVPSPEKRRTVLPGFRYDPVRDKRILDFIRFRQEEVATLIDEFGAAIKRATGGHSLALFFYGYTFENGAAPAGAGETGHFALEWLLKNGRGHVDGLSAPLSYQTHRWPGPLTVMGAAETIQRHGILWINENDNRTHHEDIWDHGGQKYSDPWRTQQCFMRDSAVQILRGYGDWWMDLFGRGWFRDEDVWKVRRKLNALDDLMLARKKPYSPEVAVVVNEESFLGNGWGSRPRMLKLRERGGYGTCGATYGQYLLNDVLADPPDAKLFVMAFVPDMTEAQREKVRQLKAARPDAAFLDVATGEELTAANLALCARRAGAHLYTKPGEADIASAEGIVMVQAQKDGPVEIDFGVDAQVRDFLTHAAVGQGPRVKLVFRRGETRIFDVRPRSAEVRVAEQFGYSLEDSTRYLQAALDSGASRIVLEAKDGPWITSKPLKGRSNQTIVFEKGTWLQAKRGCFKGLGDSLLSFVSCTNVTVLGAGPDVCGLKMWRSDYDDKSLYRHSEWRHGLAFLSCVNARVEGISVVDTGGDGLYVSTSDMRKDHDGRRGCCNVAVKNCVFDRNYRQGISIIGVDGFFAEDVVMANTKGTPPEAGIDFEPNRPWQCIRNVVLRRCRMEGNAGNGIEFAHGHLGAITEAGSILVEDTLVCGNAKGFYYPVGESDMDAAADTGSVLLRGCTFRETRGQAVFVGKRPNCRGSVSFEDCRFENCGTEAPDEPDFRLSICGHTLCEPDSFNFSNVTVVRRNDRPLLKIPERKAPYQGAPTRVTGSVRVIADGKDSLVSFDDEWNRVNCPFRPVVTPPALFKVVRPLGAMQVFDERPGEQLPCAPAFVRGRGRFATFRAAAGQEVRIKFVVATIGARTFDATRNLVIHPRGEDEVVAKIEPPRSAKPEIRTFVAPRTGFYDIYYDTAYNGVAIKSSNVPVALDATERAVPLVGVVGTCGRWLAAAKECLMIYAPRRSRVECNVSCTGGECVSLALYNPSGKRECWIPTVEGIGRCQAEADVDGFWGIRIGEPEYGAFEDHHLGVRGVPGWIFLCQGRYWK